MVTDKWIGGYRRNLRRYPTSKISKSYNRFDAQSDAVKTRVSVQKRSQWCLTLPIKVKMYEC